MGEAWERLKAQAEENAKWWEEAARASARPREARGRSRRWCRTMEWLLAEARWFAEGEYGDRAGMGVDDRDQLPWWPGYRSPEQRNAEARGLLGGR